MAQSKPPGKIVFSYEKDPGSHVIAVAGAFGGITPDLNIYMALFSEHTPLPSRTTHLLDPDGRLGPEIEEGAQSRRVDGITLVRKIETEALLSFDTAVALRKWLDEKIGGISQVRNMQNPQKEN